MWGTKRLPLILQIPLCNCFLPRVFVWSFYFPLDVLGIGDRAQPQGVVVPQWGPWIKSRHKNQSYEQIRDCQNSNIHLFQSLRKMVFMKKPAIIFSFPLPWTNLQVNFILLNKIRPPWVPKSGQIYWKVSTAQRNSNDGEDISLLSLLESSEKSI